MLVLTVVFALLNIFLGFALAAYLGRGPSGIIEILEFFSSIRSKAISEPEEAPLPEPESPVVNAIDQSTAEQHKSLDNPTTNPPTIQTDIRPAEPTAQSSEYSDIEPYSDESNLELICNEVS
jgi:hypothetical protein